MLCRPSFLGAAPSLLSNLGRARRSAVITDIGCFLRQYFTGAPSSSVVPLAANKQTLRAFSPRHLRHVNLSTQVAATSPHKARTKRTGRIIVGPFDPGIDDAQLAAFFASCGDIERVVVEKHFAEGVPVGYGYVTFKHNSSVDSALRLDRSILGGHIIYVRALLLHRDTVLIRNLGSDVDENQLRDLFGRCGTIDRVAVRTSRFNRSNVIGLVQFSSIKSAERARGLTGTMLDGKPISVQLSVQDFKRELYNDAKGVTVSTVVEIRDLPPQVDDAWLKSEFDQCGEIGTVRIMRALSKTWGTGNSLGYGYITFHSVDSANQALQLNGRLQIAGQPIRVLQSSTFVPTREPCLKFSAGTRDPTTIWVGSLTPDVDGTQLRDEFQRFGAIVRARVVKDSRKSRGFAFVMFASPDAVEEAIAHDGKIKINGFTTVIRRALLRS